MYLYIVCFIFLGDFMKKLMLGSAIFCMFGSVLAAPKSKKVESLVSIDSIQIMQKSKEGQKVAEKLRKKIEGFQEQIKKDHEAIETMEKELSKKKEVLSKDALEEKTKEVSKKKFFIEQKMENFRMEIQKEQVTLRDKQLALVDKMFKKHNWGLMIDKNTPGVLFVSKAVDKTDELLKIIDADYEASLNKKDARKTKKA